MLSTHQAICIDASVGAKWFLRDEAGSAAALELLEKFAAGELAIIAPELFLYEMGSMLSIVARRGRISAATAFAALHEVERLGLHLVRASGEMRAALAFSLRLGVSLYDAAYLAAAESQGVPLITSDERLLSAVSSRLAWVLSLDSVT